MEAATITGKLKSRKIVTNEDTYDIQTSTHNFFADDILVHNSEIILRSREFCNLTEVVVRGDDTPETLKRKVKLATILGTFQSTLTNFKYLSKKWKENCEEERLLGVSLTGIMDNEYTNGTAHRDPGRYTYNIYAQNSGTNLDPSLSLGLVEEGFMEATTGVTYYQTPSFTTPSDYIYNG